MTTRVRLDKFDVARTFQRGCPWIVESVWYFLKVVFFLSAWPWPSSIKRALLRAFGARIGRGVVIRPRVNITMPWRLEIGDHSWIGEEVYLLSLDKISIGSHCCVSQRAFLCTGNHDFRDESFSFQGKPIVIGAGVWVGASVFVGPGVEIAQEAVVTAGSVVLKSLPNGMVCSGNPAEPRSPRWKDKPGSGDKLSPDNNA